jgi:hypothetical protein
MIILADLIYYIGTIICVVEPSVGDLDPVGSGPFWSDADPDVLNREWIMALINDPILTIFVCVKAINTLGISVS